MKKLILLFVLLLLGATALAEEKPISPDIVLKSNPTTGFAWVHTILSDSDVVKVEGTYVADESTDAGQGMLMGSGGYECFVFSGIAPGEATVLFAYKRAWEETAPLYTVTYQVAVDAGMNVTILAVSFDW